MSFFDKVKSGFDKAAEGVSDFAETTRLKLEVSKLNDRKTAAFAEIGRQLYALRAQGRGLAEVEEQCKQVDGVEEEIKKIGEQIAKINAPATETPNNP